MVVISDEISAKVVPERAIDRKTMIVSVPNTKPIVEVDYIDTKLTRKNHNVLLPIHEHLDLAIYVIVVIEVSNIDFLKGTNIRMFYVLGMKWG